MTSKVTPGDDPDLLPDGVWCVPCETEHIASIPVVTYYCAGGAEHGCGFGQWHPSMAMRHADQYPDHIVYPMLHRVIPMTERGTVPTCACGHGLDRHGHGGCYARVTDPSPCPCRLRPSQVMLA